MIGEIPKAKGSNAKKSRQLKGLRYVSAGAFGLWNFFGVWILAFGMFLLGRVGHDRI
jgi:hypothetical protein